MQRVGRMGTSLAGAQNAHHETLFGQKLFKVMHFNLGQFGLEQALIAQCFFDGRVNGQFSRP